MILSSSTSALMVLVIVFKSVMSSRISDSRSADRFVGVVLANDVAFSISSSNFCCLDVKLVLRVAIEVLNRLISSR